jgi:hypothetical protein
MNGHYSYTPEIWPSFFTVFLLIALAVYSWRQRSVPGALENLIEQAGWNITASTVVDCPFEYPDLETHWRA